MDPRPKSAPSRFKPGVSGNPGGRPKGLAKAARELLGRVEAAEGDGAMVIIKFWSGILADTNAKMSDRLEASKLLAERGWGKPASFAPIEEEDPLDYAEELAAAVGKFDAEVVRLAAVRDPGDGSGGSSSNGARTT